MRRIMLIVIILFAFNLYSEWNVVNIYPIPESASGLAYDGEFLYCGIYGANGDEIFQIDPSDGSYQLIFSNPAIGDCFGLSYDGENLWLTDHVTSPSVPAVAIELSMSGEILSQFNLPDHYMSGIACDGDNFWVCTYYDPDGYIYHLDSEGNIINGFDAPDNQPWDLCIENENLWMADYWGDSLYKLNPENGELLESHPSEGVDPSGIVFDGQYIWYCDNGQGYDQDFLYQVDIGADAFGFIEGFVSENLGGTPLEGILVNIDEYTAITDETGYFIVEVPTGEYTVNIDIEWYEEFEAVVNVVENETVSLNISLQPEVVIIPPEDLFVDEHCYLSFTPPQAHPSETYNIYLDGDLLQSTDFPEYLLRDLEPGQTYQAGVSVEFAIWESDIAEFEFNPEFSHSYGDVDDDDEIAAYDASVILQYSVGIDPGAAAPLPWENWRIYCADVNADQTVEAYDAALVLQYVVGIINEFPGENSR